MKSAQAGGTECGLNWIAYIICHAPGLALMVMPSLDMARRNTRTRIDPMIAETPALRERISAPRSRDAYNSAFVKSFPGGTLVMTGANSASALRSTPCRYLLLDEIDGYPHDVDNEGDPVALAIARSVTFKGRRKIAMVSTPTVVGVSRIEAAYLEGDQRKFQVACIHCGDRAEITWQRIKWPEGRRDKAYLICDACGGVMEEHSKPALLASGVWKATAKGDGRTASFHISALYSPFVTWGEIAIEHGAAQGDPARMQAWHNLSLGLPYEDVAASPLAVGELQQRAEDYTDAPKGVLVCVAGIDTQDDRIEVEIMGAGMGDETWSLGYHVLLGDPSSQQLWEQVDVLLRERIRCVDGRVLLIRAACIDSGGHFTVQVYNFVRDKQSRSIWAIRGSSHSGTPPWPRKATRVNKGKVPLYVIGADVLKDAFAARLRIEQPGAGYCHFPIGRGLDYFEGLLSERPLRVYSGGVARRVWTPISGFVRNEPLDCRVYCYAALEGLKASGFRYQRPAPATGDVPVRSTIDSGWLHRRSWE
jgi:phage terminase large subunit GpA-like protein